MTCWQILFVSLEDPSPAFHFIFYPDPLTILSSDSTFLLLPLKYESDELEKSVYQDYDSDSDVPEELKQDYVDEQTGDAPLKRSAASGAALDH